MKNKRSLHLKKNSLSNNTVCFVAGKSGGHITPCLTIAQQLVQQCPNTKILFFSTDGHLDMKLLSTQTTITTHIPLTISHLQYTRLYHYPLAAAHLFKAFCM